MNNALQRRVERLEQRGGVSLDQLPPFVVHCPGQGTVTLRFRDGLPVVEQSFDSKNPAKNPAAH